MATDPDRTYGFIGEYEHSVDGKNRVILPSTIREKIPEDDRLVLSIGLDECLVLYPYNRFEAFVNLAGGEGLTTEARKLRRKIVGKAREVHLDSQGRIVIPGHLKDEADIDSSVTVVGNVDNVEFWSPAKWETYLSDVDLEDAAEKLFRQDR